MYCACTTWTVFGVASTGDALILLVLVLVLCLYSYYAYTRTVLVLVLCLYHCTVCTVLVPLVQCSSMASTGNVPTYPRLSSYCLVSLHSVYCACTPCIVVWHGQHGQCTYFARVCPRTVLYHCTVCTVLVPLVQWFGMATTGNVPILPVLVLVLWLYYCTVCTVFVPLVQCSSMASTGNVPILSVFVRVLCVYRNTVCTVLVPLVQWFGMASTSNIPTYPRLSLYCLYPLHSGLAWSARAMYLFCPWLYSY